MDIIFRAVANALNFIAVHTGLTYNEINILVYFFIIPFTYLVLIDIYIGKHYLKIIWVLISIVCLVSVNFNDFSNWLFNESVKFLNLLSVMGLDYVNASVIICVFLAFAFYVLLFFMIIKKRKKCKTCS
jgi:hypothetical protein